MELLASSLQDKSKRYTGLPLTVWGCIASLVAASLLYVPTFLSLSQSLWATDQNAHGPVVLIISLALLYIRTSEALRQGMVAPNGRASGLAAWLLFVVSLVLYVVGKSQSVYIFEVSSFILTALAMNALFLGWRVVANAWIGYFFLLFVIPFPGSVIDVVTQPMKLAVSMGAEQVLYQLGYPIARAGVVLNIGQYKLLVADACAGLNSLFTLEALGLLYMTLVKHSSIWRNVTMAILIVPISFLANLIRVLSLCLITYYWGDSAGQGFMHDFSGMVLFISALIIILMADSFIRTVINYCRKQSAVPAEKGAV
ncbi:exosortase B [Neiella marina]|uniref:Exosortase B n=1 Tax=Neiella holothuriorum TaxID=2870530 RepID=A0ABS7EF81_9GAMM|nr:exosortase B [Neiella holothuriorum]MBW8190583.1 exosortase B [Neiella holothuriorum]